MPNKLCWMQRLSYKDLENEKFVMVFAYAYLNIYTNQLRQNSVIHKRAAIMLMMEIVLSSKKPG